MSNNNRQSLTNTIQRLQMRIGDINRQRSQANSEMANCQTNINRLNNSLITIRNQSSPSAQKLRQNITMWGNRFRTARTRHDNLGQTVNITVNQRRDAQARLEKLQAVAGHR